jgi:hypothetical protein
MTKIHLEIVEPLPDAKPEEIARIVLARFGLLPRKKDGTAQMHKLLLELYERKKAANRDKKPEAAVMTVEDMGVFAGIKRQTMYDYLGRWLVLNLLKKTSFVSSGKVVIGYELNGGNLEAAFKKAELYLKNHTEYTINLIKDLQNEIKKEKIKAAVQDDDDEPEPTEPGPIDPDAPPTDEPIEPKSEKSEASGTAPGITSSGSKVQ